MSQVYGAFFDDRAGLAARDEIGIDQLAFETDYPHQDSTWPRTVDTVRTFSDLLDDVELRKVLHDNGAALLGLD
jgi:predicted TIM-barrel fold metal-dependent hydrolase